MRQVEGSRALVTGAAGFIGSHLSEKLLGAGAASVVGVDDLSLGKLENLETALGDERFEFHAGDCADLPEVEAALDDRTFDVCFNLAVIPLPTSLAYPKETVDRNVAMTTSICELVRSGRVERLVQFSSSEVYGTAATVPMAEDHPQNPETPYAASKLATDAVAHAYHRSFRIPVVIVRPFNNYGPRQNAGSYAGLIPNVLTRVAAGETVIVDGDGEQTRDFIYVADTAAATLRIYARAPMEATVVNLGTGHERSVLDVVRALLGALEKPEWPVQHGPPRPGDVRQHLADITTARTLFGFEPATTFDDGIARTVAWYADQLARARVA